MDESALRELMDSATAAHEPQVAAIVSGALQDGRRTRARRRLAGAAAAVALVTAGVSALAGSLGSSAGHAGAPAGRGPGPAAGHGHHSQQAAPRFPIPSWWHFVTPTVPAQAAVRHPVPVTAKAAEQLLLDQLPPGTTSAFSSQAATTDDAGGKVAVAQLAATGPDGAGTVLVQMARPGTPVQLGNLDALASHLYQLVGGIRVQETLIGLPPGTAGGQVRYIIEVLVIRQDGQEVTAGAANYRYDRHPLQALGPRPALSVEQVVKAAADPRWAWTMPASLVAGATNIPLPAVVPKP